tara:strand:- start:2067 stop:2426 length:360 start_codon:yes stop_codon:yes gene_type:complete
MQRKTKKSKGLGDTLEKITEATGIKAAVKFLAGDDCGCDKRKEILNRLVPYKKANCLNETDYDYLTAFFADNKSTLDLTQQRALSKIYLNVFNINIQSTNCSSCWRDYIANLNKVYNEY